MSAARSFAALLDRARQRDPEAIGELCRQYEARLRVAARVRLGPALRPYLDSMDLVQSVHRSLLIGFRQDKFSITTPENLIALALTLLQRKVARHWRRLQRQHQGDPANPDLLPQILATLSSPQAGPEEVAQFHDQVEMLCRQLSFSERKVLALRLDGYTLAEIAQQLGLNQVTLRVRLTRLRERLRASGVLHEWI